MQTAIMDSSPQPAPVRRPLKRSASTASLPTPPYYAERRKRRSASQHDSDSDSDDVDELDSDQDVVERTEEDKHLTSKRLGLLGLSAAPPSHKRPKLSKDKTTTDSAPAEDKDAEATTAAGPSKAAAPISPPRSKRQTRSATKAAEVVVPRTPPPRAAKSKAVNARRPIRGSPGNPFIDDGRKVERPPPRRESEEFEEKPTVEYVFRGVKATFDNPLYGLSPSVRARARLPIDDPEFSPDPAVPPRRLLFTKKDACDSDDDESDGGESQKVRPKRLFATTSAAAR
ncbi:hypothetical protein AURDEDRAFT_110259 [Auricularia subglabra TFB-10046 SS5]|nr:hypothetical protein AURDEDRAFT_110259 [Auricularia subglabra TFB-10046 SS5]